MKKLLGLIVLFIIAAVVLTLVQYFKNPSELIKTTPLNQTAVTSTSTQDRNPLISPKQEEALLKIGIDPATLPKTITPAMEACFVSQIGAERVAAIKAGDMPTMEEVFKGKSCL